jgi:hypothetical protein
MFEPKTIRIGAIVAMILSAIGLLSSVVLIASASLAFIMGVISCGFLLWASYLGFKLSSYKLDENEYKKIGINILLIIGAFILYFFIGFILGFILSVVLLGTLYSMKTNYDEWQNSTPVRPEIPEKDPNDPTQD